MKKTPIIAAFLFTVVFSSCESENKKSSETVVDESSTTLSMPVDSLTDTAQTQTLSAPGQITVTDASGNPAPNMAPAMAPATAPAVASGSSEGLNPEHGKPGHKCEIPVGAPLNSAPKGNSMNGSVNVTPPPPTITTTPAIPAAPAPTVTPTVPPAAATKPGMNPPHGEPGHDCNIAVGAPLKK